MNGSYFREILEREDRYLSRKQAQMLCVWFGVDKLDDVFDRIKQSPPLAPPPLDIPIDPPLPKIAKLNAHDVIRAERRNKNNPQSYLYNDPFGLRRRAFGAMIRAFPMSEYEEGRLPRNLTLGVLFQALDDPEFFKKVEGLGPKTAKMLRQYISEFADASLSVEDKNL